MEKILENEGQLKAVLRLGGENLQAGIQKGNWDGVREWFRLLDQVVASPKYAQIPEVEKEKLAREVERAVRQASYSIVPPGKGKVEGVELLRDITIKGKPHTKGYYKVPEEMSEGLALWLADKGFARLSASEERR